MARGRSPAAVSRFACEPMNGRNLSGRAFRFASEPADAPAPLFGRFEEQIRQHVGNQAVVQEIARPFMLFAHGAADIDLLDLP